MVCDVFSHGNWFTQWLLDLSWVFSWYSSLMQWSFYKNIDDIHDGHMEMVPCLENCLIRRRKILHLGRGHWMLENTGCMRCLHGALGFTRGHLGCVNIHLGRVDLVEHMV